MQAGSRGSSSSNNSNSNSSTSSTSKNHNHNNTTSSRDPEHDYYEEKRNQRAQEARVRRNEIEMRRNTVFSLASQGMNQYEIAKILHVTQPVICHDIAYLREYFKNQIKRHVEYELPLLYNLCMVGISDVIRHAYSIYSKPDVPDQIKIAALNLISDCQAQRLDMATSGEIIQRGVAFVENSRANITHLVHSIPEQNIREMLYEEIADQHKEHQRQLQEAIREQEGIHEKEEVGGEEEEKKTVVAAGDDESSGLSERDDLSSDDNSGSDNIVNNSQHQNNEDLSQLKTDPENTSSSFISTSSTTTTDSSLHPVSKNRKSLGTGVGGADTTDDEEPTHNTVF